MQIKEQLKGREWKVVAVVTTAGALGFSGLALAGPSVSTTTPDPIDLRDRTSVTSTTGTGDTQFTFPSYMFSHSADTTWDSPFDSTPSLDTDSPSPSPSPTTNSPSPSPDSPSPSPDSPSPSPDSVSDSSQSIDSPSSADS